MKPDEFADRFADEIMRMPTWDTHNHLDGCESLAARSFWDIAHYFWFVRELEGVGYPYDPDELPEDARRTAFCEALARGRNTYWNRALRSSMRELFDVEITDEASLEALEERIRATSADPEWPRAVCGKAGIVTLTVGARRKENGIERIGDLLYTMGGLGMCNASETQAIMDAPDQRAAAEEHASALVEKARSLHAAGIRVLRVPMPFTSSAEGAATDSPDLSATGNTPWAIAQRIGHLVYPVLDELGMHLQIFSGMQPLNPSYKPRTKAQRSCALNDTRRLVDLLDVFDMYCGATFELVSAAELNALDIVQLARVHRNVVAGGLWWFNFRASTYRANMQYRIEALPACRSTLLATDARCIEWAYIKTRLVKRLLAEFLAAQVRGGWQDEDSALYTARCWLHDTAARYYRPAGPAA